MTEDQKRIEALERELADLRRYVLAIGKAVGVEDLTPEEEKQRARSQWFAEGDAWREELRHKRALGGGR